MAFIRVLPKNTPAARRQRRRARAQSLPGAAAIAFMYYTGVVSAVSTPVDEKVNY
jgi:hypothetical protein